MLSIKNIIKIGLKSFIAKVLLYITKLKNEIHKNGERDLKSRHEWTLYITITITNGKNNRANWII